MKLEGKVCGFCEVCQASTNFKTRLKVQSPKGEAKAPIESICLKD